MVNSKLNCVYWIHLKDHSDITTEGYVGVTSKEPEERYKQHVAWSKKSNIILAKALRKHGDDIVVTTLLKGSEEYCYLMEQKLRPTDRIGWNTVAGGGKPPVKNTPHTEEAKKKISEASKRNANSPAHIAYRKRRFGRKLSEETKLKISEAQLGKQPWESKRANLKVWLQAGAIYDVWKETGMGSVLIARTLDVPTYTFQVIVNKFKNNWNPHNDPLWAEWFQKQTNK